VLKCSDISEEHTASFIRVQESVEVDEEVIWRKIFCQLHRMVWGNLASHSYGGHKEVIGLSQASGVL
jgi:hypothetical protein